MRSSVRFIARAFALAGLVVATGCATTGTHDDQTPTPSAKTDKPAKASKPVVTKKVTDLLRAANESFELANEAQEQGDHKAALRHYSAMLKSLVQADLDPRVYYELRPEFERILQQTSHYANLFDDDGKLRTLEPQDIAKGPVANDLPMPTPMPEAVLREIEEIQEVYPKNFQAGLDRYFEYAEDLKKEFALAGLPQDLIWLAMVESQFHPRVVSHAGAAGMWQFMRTTGRRYNLRIDSYVDERFNWRKETRAAVSYLNDLCEIFDGEWPLAISSYNMGEGGMGRVIAANGGDTNIWNLIESSRMPRETQKFYPKLLASVMVARDPEKYGFALNKREPEACRLVPIKGCYSLAALDKACGLSSGTLKRLNADLIKGVTPPTGEFQLVMPEAAAGRIGAALKKVPKYRPDLHVVRRGETLGGIAKRFGVSVRELQTINKIRSPRSLQVGKRLVIPGAYSPSGSSSSSSAPVKTASGATTYRVKRGDALSKIAAAHGVRMRDIQAWNGMGRKTTIKVGQALRVAAPGTKPAPESTAVAKSTPVKSEGSPTIHVVRAGEFPAKIAKMHGVKLDDFLAWNHLTKTSMIQVGDNLTVHGSTLAANKAARKSAPSSGEEKVYKVASGDSPWLIASREGVELDDFLQWNGLSKKSVLKVGQEVVIRQSSGNAPAPKSAPKTVTKNEPEKITHTVGRGQCAGSIAQRYGVKLSDLLKWNGLSRKSVLKVGQKLVVYKAS